MDIFFNEKAHKYTDSLGNIYTSVSQLIQKFETTFDYNFWVEAKGIELLVATKKGREVWNNLMYKYKQKHGKNAWKELVEDFKKVNPDAPIQEYTNIIAQEWEDKNHKAITTGNAKHNYLEHNINKSLGLEINKQQDQIKVFTILDAVNNWKKLKNDTEHFNSWKNTYPSIYKAFNTYVDKGYTILSEIVTYSVAFRICGTIDVPILNFDKECFYIEDWKTNEKVLHFESGYYRKEDGVPTDEWITTDDRMKFPLDHLMQCSGISYQLQLSLYAYLVERLTGFTCKGLVINHIRDESYKRIPVVYLKEEAQTMLKSNIK